MGLTDFSFYDLINRNALAYGNRPAWLEAKDGRSVSFSQYKDAVDRLAAGMQKAGVVKGDCIGVLGKNRFEFFKVYGAAAALGAIVVPINWRLSADEVCFNLNDTRPVVVFADAEFQEMLESRRQTLDSVGHFVNLEAGAGRFEDFKSFTGDASKLELPAVTSDDGLVIIHTAAVAGRPRGALVSHGNLLCADVQWMHRLALSTRSVHLNLLPLFHVAGLFMATAGFHAGALNVNMEKFDAVQAAELIQSKGVTYFFDFSPILENLMTAAEANGLRLDTLQSVVGLDSPEVITAFQNLTGGVFYCMYGQTETSSVATYGRYDDCPGSAGRPIPMAEVLLVDDYDRPVAPGAVGEITVRGPMVFKGYWNLPEDTAHTFREGRHHTGDLGRFDANGFLWYAGRKTEKELIKPGGENVYPAEVEKVILQHPDVEETVVFGIPDPKWKEAIKAVCRLKAGAELAEADLIEFVGQRIARFKKPKVVAFVDDLPRTEDGAVDRNAVKETHGGAGGLRPQD
jgi:acyl-CoA synthetase (AMP-forming)/AMP-acid ligase II